MSKRSKTFYIFNTLKGMAMGAADVVPGVSGGTIAFISGIYEELLETINRLNLKTLKILFKDGFKEFWKAINGNFLASLLLGIAISVVSFAKGISFLLHNYPIELWSFFFGLVLASVLFVGKDIDRSKAGSWIALVLGVLIALYITQLKVGAYVDNPWYLFLSGALAICAMILPGISGSFILVLLGSYETVLNAVHQRDLQTIAIVGAGAIVGLLSFSKLLKWTFDHYKNTTLALLTGFILGSLNKIWPWKEVLESKLIDGKEFIIAEQNVSPFHSGNSSGFITALLLSVGGFLLIYILEKSVRKNP